MILELSRIIETSTLGAARIGEELLRLHRTNELVRGIEFLPQKVGEHQVVKVKIRFAPKPSMTKAEAERWFRHKTTSWLNGYVLYDAEEVRCDEA